MNRHYKRMRPLLGTFVEIGVSRDSPGYEQAVTLAFSKIKEVHSFLSFHDPYSDLSNLNSSFGSDVTLNPISIVALRLARRMTDLTGGLFNCTIGGRMIEESRLPNHDGSSVIGVGFAGDIEIRGLTVRLKRPIRITMDGIAKGYAVDLAVKLLKKMGVVDGWVNAGGDLKVFGRIHLPVRRREIDGEFSCLGSIHETAVATSVVGGQADARFPGVILSGNFAIPQAGSWTVLAKSAWLADALTKAAALASNQKRQALLASFGAQLLPTMKFNHT